MQQDDMHHACLGYMGQPYDQMADYGEELADHMAELEQLKQMRLAESDYLEYGPGDGEDDLRRVRRRKRKNSGQI